MACSWSAAASPPPPRMVGNDLSTLPDFPAEIRAPAGTPHGVSAFQIHFASRDILTPGDHPNTLVAMNPAALKANLAALEPGGTLILNEDAFTDEQPAQGRLRGEPARRRLARRLPGLPRPDDLDDDARHRGHRGAETGRGAADQERLRARPRLVDVRPPDRGDALLARGQVRASARRSARPTSPPSTPATTSARRPSWRSPGSRSSRRRSPPASTATSTAPSALALGLIAASVKSGLQLLFASYPITPASELLHHLARHDRFGVRTVQAEDEIAAANMALGAAFAGRLGVTATSGPGMDLKAETIGLAVMLELPMVIVDVQRAGPSTGMPTKTEQTDLLMAIHGRHGESPLPVIAASTPADCFDAAVEAVRIAVRYRTPVILLSDTFLANSSEPWRIPEHRRPARHRPALRHRAERRRRVPALPARRERRAALGDPRHARPPAPDRRPREGATAAATSATTPANHALMTRLRPEKLDKLADGGPAAARSTPTRAPSCWCSAGARPTASIRAAARRVRDAARRWRLAHLRHLNPLPAQHRRGRPRLPEGADPGDEHRPAAEDDPRRVPGRRGRRTTRWRACRSSPRSWRARSWRRSALAAEAGL